MPDLPRADLAEMQVRRQSRRPFQRRNVALLSIVVEGLCQEALQALLCARLPRFPLRGHCFVPRHLRQQAEGIERGGFWPALWLAVTACNRQGPFGVQFMEQSALEGRVNLVGLAALVQEGRWIRKECAVEFFGPYAAAPQLVRHDLGATYGGGLVSSVPMHSRGARFGGQLLQKGCRAAVRHYQ